MVRSIALGISMVLALTFGAAAQDTLSPLARSIQSDVNRLDSRVSARANQPRESERLQGSPRDRGRAELIAPTKQRSARDIALSSDLGAAKQDLRTLKTREPDADSIPLLEQQYDRINRQAGAHVFQPSRNPAALYAR